MDFIEADNKKESPKLPLLLFTSCQDKQLPYF